MAFQTPMDMCIMFLRYVKKGDFVLHDDINVPIQCIFAARTWMEEIALEYGVDPSIVRELDPYIQKLRYVKAGDIIEPEDHNTIVDALKAIRDVLAKLEKEVYAKGYQAGYKEGYEAGMSPRSEAVITTPVVGEEPPTVFSRAVITKPAAISEKPEIKSEVGFTIPIHYIAH